MVDDATFAMLCREHDAATGGDKLALGQRYREPGTRIVWTIRAIRFSGGERDVFLTSAASGVMRLPASLVATTYERLSDGR